ncbi:ArsR/SmtB family transcription factor [Halanaerobaculum tunisiense]
MQGKILEIENKEETIKVMKALSSESRINILELLNSHEMNLNEISNKLDMPPSSVTVNIKKLEEAGLIKAHYKPGSHGSQKLCSRTYDSILIRFLDSNVNFNANLVKVSMPIGNYKDFDIKPSCGIATKEGYVGILDDERSFFEPEHSNAQLLWFEQGYIKYKFPNNLPANSTTKKLELSMEICSEAPGFNKEWPSDITIWINGIEVGTWTCPGDFGEKRGKLNPNWWNAGLTQYGLLKVWTIDDTGTYIDGKQISKKKISDLDIQENKFINFKIGVKEDARNVGGINLFGSKFGNYEQDIIMRLHYAYKD